MIQFLTENGVALVNVGSSDIVDGNQKITLGLIWSIILRFQVADINVNGVSGKQGLLLWVQRLLAGTGVTVSNFTSR